MKSNFDKAKVILDGEDAYLCIGVPYHEAKKFVGEMKPVKYTVEIKEYRERRTLDSNAYVWSLIGALSGKLRIPPEEIYRDAIRDVGGNYEVLPIKNEALERWKEIWSGKGLGWIVEEIGPSKLDGYTNVRCFYGSSVYDKGQMSRLIDIIVEECKAQDIETLPPAKLTGMIEEWGT